MATRRRIIEGRWRCTSCGTADILGRHKVCPSCGSPREQEERRFEFGARDARGAAQSATVSDAAALSAAQAGADWDCLSCQAGNRGDADRCRACGTPRSPAPPAAPGAAASQARPRARRWGVVALALGLLALVCGGALWWRDQEYDVEGRVAARSWLRSEQVQRFTPVVEEGWRTQLVVAPTVMPIQGVGGIPGVENLRGCVNRQSGTRQVPNGTTTVCEQRSRSVACGQSESCTVNDLGNGFAEEVCTTQTDYCTEYYEECRQETVYRDEPVYDDWCTYDTWAWETLADQTLTGADDPPRWPGLAAQGDLQRLVRAERATLRFAWEEDGEAAEWSKADATLAEWAAWPTGAAVLVRLSNGGEVRGIRHPGEPPPEP